jgi:hypothetical protein
MFCWKNGLVRSTLWWAPGCFFLPPVTQVVLQFPHVFWDDSVDYFGAAAEQDTPEGRGWCFMFWNFHRFSGKPTLAALVSGAADVESSAWGVQTTAAKRCEQRAAQWVVGIEPSCKALEHMAYAAHLGPARTS